MQPILAYRPLTRRRRSQLSDAWAGRASSLRRPALAQLGRVELSRVRQCAMRLGRQLVVTGIAVSALGFSKPAAADARFSGDEVRITVDDAGLARVEHAIGYRVTGSLPMGFDL